MAKRPTRSVSKSAAGPPKTVLKATNRRARRNYVIEESLEAGIMLTGSEVKSLRMSTPTLSEGYARFERDTLWLYGIHIPPLAQASYLNHEPTRKRQLLLHKRELRKLRLKLEAKGMTLVPLSLYFKGPHVKVELGLGRGRTKGDRRQRDREKQDRRQIRDATS